MGGGGKENTQKNTVQKFMILKIFLLTDYHFNTVFRLRQKIQKYVKVGGIRAGGIMRSVIRLSMNVYDRCRPPPPFL
jgi:hypothetical protein